jgi:hypothetical protein
MYKQRQKSSELIKKALPTFLISEAVKQIRVVSATFRRLNALKIKDEVKI